PFLGRDGSREECVTVHALLHEGGFETRPYMYHDRCAGGSSVLRLVVGEFFSRLLARAVF
ncbi:MAG TPA: hypothetical protein VIH98_07490, partial [Xanthobacteraceae bacterium]